jgi:glycosyltransferase involved in cell wall biosynthesis
MFLSIIIPSYNHGQFIERCLKSILYQRFEHGYEIIVVDKFSNDQTQNIIRKYQKKYKNIFFFKKNYDQSQAINFGFKKSKGLYCTWQNCDDFYLKNSFNYFYKTYKKDNNADIIYGNMNLIDINSKFIRSLYFNRVNFFQLISEGMVISNQSSIFKRILFPKFNLNKYHNSFDYDFFLNLSYNKKKFLKVLTNKSLAAFRIYDEQKSFYYSEDDLLFRKSIINKYSSRFLRTFFYNKIISKILRLFFMIKDTNFKFTFNYFKQKKFNV